MENANTIILSRAPYSQCFFCGGAGAESVVEVVFNAKPTKFKADQLLVIKGKLKLNDKDIAHMNFILENASVQSKK